MEIQKCTRRDFLTALGLGATTLALPRDMLEATKAEQSLDNKPPPYTDYCSMLSQEIQGRKHAFMAGNLVYYVGGRYNCWEHAEDETIGLTHPFYHDLRGRGYGITTHKGSGTGHDFKGWEFYSKTKVAYGTVIINGKEHLYPVPVSMKWRPDKMICDYKVNGVKIHEEKFVAKNDVICSIIRADAPVTLRFDGHSLMIPHVSRTNTSEVSCDSDNNCIHIKEGGTVTTHPVKGETVEGKLIYDGMHTVLSSSKKITSYNSETKENGQRTYSFEVVCDSKGVALTWSMDDNYAKALTRTKEVLAEPKNALNKKTQYMNNLLNYQVPYFRCSDKDIVNIYYYLWSIYLMYYIDVGKGWEKYPHTQTAVNNFLGMHRYDANFQIQVGAWTADKEYYAYGNVLHWKPLLPYAKGPGLLPDNKGISWFSPVWGTTTEHVVGAWKIYQHTSDKQFLHKCYDDYFRILFKDGIASHWGCNYDAARYLRKMAKITGDHEDPDRWLKMVNMKGLRGWLHKMWEKNGVPNYFGAGGEDLGWSGFAYLRNSYFPEKWAKKMAKEWAIDSEKGFFWKVPLSTKARKDWETVSEHFTATPDTNYYSLIGMYNSNVVNEANTCTLAHLKKYNMNWDIPIAPESWDIEPTPWGDQYSNFNAGKILLILEGMAGISYSIPDDNFVVCDKMPKQWDYLEVRIPLKKNGKSYWVKCKTTKQSYKSGKVKKKIRVSGNPFAKLNLQPWLEENALIKGTKGYKANEVKGHVSYSLRDKTRASVEVELK